MTAAPFTVQKLGYWAPVKVVDGVPLCPCCQEPMVERDGGWMCALGAAVLDAMAGPMATLDALILGGAA